VIVQATKDTFDTMDRFDKLKEFHESHDPEKIKLADKDTNFSVFPLFYLLHNRFEGGIHEIESEALDYLFSNKITLAKAKVLASVFTADAIWTNIFALNAFICAANNKKFEMGFIEELTAEEVVWGLIMIGSIEGSFNLPFSPDCSIAIVGWLKEDGWTVPPLSIFVPIIFNYFDAKEGVQWVTETFSDVGLVNLVEGEMPTNLPPDEMNYLGSNKIVAAYVAEKIQKVTEDWTSSIRSSMG